ncbi:MAG TPA: DUF6326 family protein [Candidatus Angelobacter sp.]|nr:DUF6326 family protein [Candidatus Angelobacter sp.]
MISQVLGKSLSRQGKSVPPPIFQRGLASWNLSGRRSRSWAQNVLRCQVGQLFKAGEIGGRKISQNLLLGIAILMAISSLWFFLSLTLNYPSDRWANIVAAIVFFGFNLIGLPTYPSAHDRFLIVVGLGF